MSSSAPSPAPTSTPNPYTCTSYPTLDGATSAPPAYWPPERNATAGQRACVAFPNYYMVQCCGQPAPAIHDPKCGWEVCISATTDDQWDACFKQMDAQRGASTGVGYSYNCAEQATEKNGKDSKQEDKKSGARRRAVAGLVVVVACAALAVI